MGLELYFDMDVFEGVEFAVCVGVNKQYSDVNFSAIAIVHLHYLIIVVDNIGHKHNPLHPQLLRINRFRRIRARTQRRINQQVRGISKMLHSVINLSLFAQIQIPRIHQIKSQCLPIRNSPDVRIRIGDLGLVKRVDGRAGD